GQTMKSILILFLAVTLISLVKGDEKLQIGIKKKIAPEDCKMKTRKGDQVSMHYTGSLKKDGSVFDSSVTRGEPFKFKLGVGQVIRGWDQGLLGMCIGEKRKLVIPPQLGYGDSGAGDKIPPKSTLVFEVELLDIDRKTEL
uniref:peptidylprolyl isomerase n=2 Tax=Ciona savignyi TaxID=51511 RepID=H2YI58_CIOSA